MNYLYDLKYNNTKKLFETALIASNLIKENSLKVDIGSFNVLVSRLLGC